MKYYVVDAFADGLFKGNPAGVCILDNELDEELMQNIAMENNLSETAFVVRKNGNYGLRWFTPSAEVDLCGHATLAAAFVIADIFGEFVEEMRFDTKSGVLTVHKRDDGLFELDFPANKPLKTTVLPEMERAVGVPVVEAYKTRDLESLILIVESEYKVREVKPDLELIKKLAPLAVNVTAKGDDVDFVSRFFAPNVGVPEDHVTGSAHTRLVPLWAERLGKDRMTAVQLSKRGGVLFCEDCGQRVRIAGRAVLYLRGEINI